MHKHRGGAGDCPVNHVRQHTAGAQELAICSADVITTGVSAGRSDDRDDTVKTSRDYQERQKRCQASRQRGSTTNRANAPPD